MKLPNAAAAHVERKKIVEYLLNPDHPDNGGKAQFFVALGFSADYWELMAGCLHRLVLAYSVSRSVESQHGKKYIVDGAIETPSGRSPMVRSIWFIESGETIPRLVTAYPQRKTQ